LFIFDEYDCEKHQSTTCKGDLYRHESSLRFVSTHRRNKVAPCPEVLPSEIAPTPSIHPRNMDRTFAFDKPDHMRYCYASDEIGISLVGL